MALRVAKDEITGALNKALTAEADLVLYVLHTVHTHIHANTLNTHTHWTLD